MWYDPYKITNVWILLGIAVGFGVFESFWRRWFGGGFKLKNWLKFLNHRFFQHVVNVLALFSVCYWVRGLVWYWALYATLVMQLLFWTLAHGMYFDMGRGGPPTTDKEKKRYNEAWFSKFLDWCFDEPYRYSTFYDYCGMLLRYTWPVVLMVFVPTFNSGIVLLGQWTAFVYGIGLVLGNKSILKRISRSNFGEFAAGAGVGVGMVLVGML